ncbi:MAG: hypothetical protein ABR974_13625 [Bacteroidales bacterium]|jgi:outer membrane protein W
MKKISIIVAMLLLPLATQAQLALKVGLTANGALGDMNNYWTAGPGVDLSLKYILTKHISAGISTGFQHFFPNDSWDDEYNDYDDESLNIIPIRLSFAYYVGEKKFRPYFGAELGLTHVILEYSDRYSYYDYYYGTLYATKDVKDESTKFSASPVAGFYINFGNSKVGIDVNARYYFVASGDNDSDREKANYLGVSAGLVFRFW